MTPIYFFLYFWMAYQSAFHIDLSRCSDCECLNVDYVLMNVIISMDMITRFFFGYHTKTRIILDQGQIARHYLKTYFIFDLISCVPVMYILSLIDMDDEAASTHLLHDMIMLRILTIPRFFKLLSVSSEVSDERFKNSD